MPLPLNLCTDNGAMIAWAGLERMEAASAKTEDPLSFAPGHAGP